MKNKLRGLLAQALTEAQRAGRLVNGSAAIEIESPRQEGHGDLATNLAMVLARTEKKPPRQLAQIILDHLPSSGDFLAQVEVAGPGFINFTLAEAVWQAVVDDILAQGQTYGRSDLGAGSRVQVEFVSANPTGPLHVGHGRGAALGDALARLLAATGYEVQREYYINDAGRQMQLLGLSVQARARELLGRPVDFPEEGYQGDYIKDLAQLLLDTRGEALVEADPWRAAGWAAEVILGWIRADLEIFGIGFDLWFSEKSLHDSGRLKAILDGLEDQGTAYRAEGAVWYRTQSQGDEKDRVLIKSNGELTYFAADVAYHADKFQRGFEWVIDVWGADHHGYVPRLEAAIKALSAGRMRFTAKLVQLVNLLRAGQPVAMSKRAGHIVTLREVLDEVGSDACRFIFLTRRSDSPLDFDLEVAKSQSLENPVYYVQYAHARVASILRKAAEAGVAPPGPGEAVLNRLNLTEELNILKVMSEYPDLVAGAAASLEPHRVTFYLTELAGLFHNYYNHHRVLQEDLELGRARLALAVAVKTVIANGLGLLGVSAPERMDREPGEALNNGG